MAYLAIARKWRPQRFEDLVGQGHVVQTLKNAIRLGRVSHAYLFSGARGVGKTSVARIFAKALRCPNVQDGTPCEVCPECVAIAESRSVDVAEIDGASHNGVEAVRSIRDNVAYSASTGTYKIYIIDEVHMLSLSAFNALLKTLEEPPAHVIFVLATTESQKIPVTILSRCQRFEFRRLSQTQIVDRLQSILTAENVRVGEEGLRLIASQADGSLRDALSLLDQVLSHAGGTAEITAELVVQALGVNAVSTVTEFVESVVLKNVPALLKSIADTFSAGVDLKHFAERLLEEIRLLYLATLARENTNLALDAAELDVSSGHFEKLRELASRCSLSQVERMAQILAKTIQQLGWSSLPRFVLEMTAIRLTQLDDLDRLERALLGKEDIVLASSPAAAPTALAPAAPVAKVVPITTAAPAPVAAVVVAPAPSAAPVAMAPRPEPVAAVAPPTPPPVMRVAPSSPPPQSAPPGYVNTSTPTWKGFVEAVMKKRPLLGALLGHADFQIEEGKRVTLTFAENSFYERQATDTKNRSEIEEWMKIYFGRDIQLNFVSAREGSFGSIEQTRETSTAELKKHALEHPTVQKMKEILGADVVDVNVEV